jgi:predicted nuclease with TOPRIM domain
MVAPDAERFSTAATLQRLALGSVGIHVGRDAEFRSGLLAMPTSLALAVEMSLHEEQERRAMEGELADLTRAWREAEEIAAIADDLLLPDAVREAMRRLRGEPPAG